MKVKAKENLWDFFTYFRSSCSKGMLMVVSKQWFEFCPEIQFRYPLFTSIEPPFLPQFYLILTSFLPLLRRESRTTVWKPRFTDPWLLSPMHGQHVRFTNATTKDNLREFICPSYITKTKSLGVHKALVRKIWFYPPPPPKTPPKRDQNEEKPYKSV